jgi:hypothetical protein
MRPLKAGQAAAALGRVQVVETMGTALDEAGMRLAEAVRAALAEPPGGSHEHPWQQTGALQSSVGYQRTELSGEVGSNDPAAGPQEFGTATVPPRPFLAPVAAALGESIAQQIAAAVTAAIKHAVD